MDSLEYARSHTKGTTPPEFSFTIASCAAGMFVAGHMISEVVTGYLLQIRFPVVYPTPTNPVQAERYLLRWISGLFIEFFTSIMVAALLVFALMVFRWLGLTLPRRVFARAVVLGVVFCAVRWVFYFTRDSLPFRYDDSTNPIVAAALALVLSPFFVWPWRRGRP